MGRQREIATIQAREEAETKKVQEEEHKKAEAVKIDVEQDLAVQTENQKREIEVADQNRQRARNRISDFGQFNRQPVDRDAHSVAQLIQHLPGRLMHQVLVDVLIAQAVGLEDFVNESRNGFHSN